jgi:hypothetical protein
MRIRLCFVVRVFLRGKEQAEDEMNERVQKT